LYQSVTTESACHIFRQLVTDWLRVYTVPLLRSSARINGFWCCPWLQARVEPKDSCPDPVSRARGVGLFSCPSRTSHFSGDLPPATRAPLRRRARRGIGGLRSAEYKHMQCAREQWVCGEQRSGHTARAAERTAMTPPPRVRDACPFAHPHHLQRLCCGVPEARPLMCFMHTIRTVMTDVTAGEGVREHGEGWQARREWRRVWHILIRKHAPSPDPPPQS
jgi:hypothetical protein